MIFYEFTSDPKLKVGSEYSYRSEFFPSIVQKVSIVEYDIYCGTWADHRGNKWDTTGLKINMNLKFSSTYNKRDIRLLKDIWCDKIPRLLPTYFYDIS